MEMSFSIDPYEGIRHILQVYYEDNYNGNPNYTIAKKSSLVEILYSDEIAEEEITIISNRFAEKHGLGGEWHLMSEDNARVAEIFNEIFQLPRYKKIHWENVVKGYGPYDYSVIDLIAKEEYESHYTEHYETLVKILDENYADEFDELSQEEKDEFIIKNFKLIGSSKDIAWYVPDVPLDWLIER